jgi:hypothetical protein
MPAPPPSTTMVNVLERLEVLKQVAEKSNAKLMLSKNDVDFILL